MMTELEPSKIGLYAGAFSGAHAELVTASIIAGNTAGQLWTLDQPAAPPVVLLWDQGNNVFYVAGQLTADAARRELAALLTTTIRPRALQERMAHFKVRALSASCEAALPLLFAGVALSELRTLFYGLSSAQPTPQLWQIGVDMLPPYQGRGIGTALVSRVTEAVLASGRVPYYTTRLANLRSGNTALAAGYWLGWSEVYANDRERVPRTQPR